MKLFDENEAIAFIRNMVAESKCLTNDDILEVIDSIFNFYDEAGELDLDFDDVNDIDDAPEEETIINYVIETLSDLEISSETISEIVRAELSYEQSLL